MNWKSDSLLFNNILKAGWKSLLCRVLKHSSMYSWMGEGLVQSKVVEDARLDRFYVKMTIFYDEEEIICKILHESEAE